MDPVSRERAFWRSEFLPANQDLQARMDRWNQRWQARAAPDPVAALQGDPVTERTEIPPHDGRGQTEIVEEEREETFVLRDGGEAEVSQPERAADERSGDSVVPSAARDEHLNSPRTPAPPEVSVAIDLTSMSQMAMARWLDAELAAWRWAPEVREGEVHEIQQSREQDYKAWALSVLAARVQTYGSQRPYVAGVPMGLPWREALMPATFDGVRQLLSSAVRSPVRNAVVTALSPTKLSSGEKVGELTNDLDPAAIGGAIGGLAAYTADTLLLQPMQREARRANLSVLKPVNLSALIPDPGAVRLRVESGYKRYESVSAQERAATAARRQVVAQWQANLEGKGEAVWWPAAMTGALNVLRRTRASAHDLSHPGSVFVGSMWASGSAGFISQATLGMARALPWWGRTEVDDLVGGKQRVNLFAPTAHDPSRSTARWSDIGRLPWSAARVARDGADRLRLTVRWDRSWLARWGQLKNIFTAMHNNTTASIAAAGSGPLMGQILRSGRPEPGLNESPQSSANLLQQFTQSMMNDYVWNAAKSFTRDDAYDLSPEVKQAKAQGREVWTQAIDEAQRELQTWVSRWRSACEQTDHDPLGSPGAQPFTAPPTVQAVIDHLGRLEEGPQPSSVWVEAMARLSAQGPDMNVGDWPALLQRAMHGVQRSLRQVVYLSANAPAQD